VLDSSAVVAILTSQTGFDGLLEKMRASRTLAIGAPTVLECSMVMARHVTDPRLMILGRLRLWGAQIVPFTDVHFDVAIDAFLRFGKGRHPAGLNFGDCMSYAIAQVEGLPLLFTGDAFARTDIPRA
jgi:ribonuclease VapC